MSDVCDKAAFIWVFAVFSPDGTHEWCLLIIHAIKCYLCLLSPVSARKRKRAYGREGENEGQKAADDKNHSCGHMHVHLYEWTRTPSRCLNARAYQTRPQVWHALISRSLSLRTNVLRYPLATREEIKLLQRIWRVFFPSPCSLMACCYLCRWTQTLPANNFLRWTRSSGK